MPGAFTKTCSAIHLPGYIKNYELAIKKGIDLLAASDVLVILGKGHERFQEIEGVSHPFSDSEVAEGWIKQGADHHD